jgi:hypothetical protein
MTRKEKRTGLVSKFQEGSTSGLLGFTSQPQGIPGRVHTLLLGSPDLLFDTLDILLVLLTRNGLPQLRTTIARGEAVLARALWVVSRKQLGFVGVWCAAPGWVVSASSTSVAPSISAGWWLLVV